MRLLPVAIAMLAWISLAHAEGPTVDFGSEHYTLNFEDQAQQEDGSSGEGLAEFTLPGETVNDWSKLFAFHAHPEMGDDPVAAVKMVGKVVKETNKDANYAIVENEKTGEAIIDFLTWAPDSDVMEFNVFKYARAKNGKGLIALQYAQHIKLGDLDVEGMRALRAKSVEYMVATNIAQARDYFAGKAEKSDAAEADESNSSDDESDTPAAGAGADR
jgi:hypothetical protein